MRAGRSSGRAAVLWLLACVALAGCGEDRTDRGSGALRADPLARYVPPGATLVRERVTAGGTDALGKQRGASVRRDFNLPAGSGRDTALAAAIAAAIAAGWTVDVGAGQVPGFARVRRTVGTGQRTATLSIPRREDPLGNGLRYPALVLVLRG